jgi:hypothetical protein
MANAQHSNGVRIQQADDDHVAVLAPQQQELQHTTPTPNNRPVVSSAAFADVDCRQPFTLGPATDTPMLVTGSNS